MKGEVHVHTQKTRRYAEMYRAWYKSDHDTLIVRCVTSDILKHAGHAARRFRENNELQGYMSISKYDGDLYLMKIGNQKYAMEAFPNEDGWIFYYDTDKEIMKDD